MDELKGAGLLEEGYKGFVLKKSKHLGTVRKRLLVLDGDILKSFKDEESDKPTETIQLSQTSTAIAEMKGTGVFRLVLGSTGEQRNFTCESDESASQWVSKINEAAKFSGLQGEILKKNEDIERLTREVQTLENHLRQQKELMETQKTKHKDIIDELLTVHGEELTRLNPGAKKSKIEQNEDIQIGDWVTAKISLTNKRESLSVGIIRYIGDGPSNGKTVMYGFEITDGTLGPHDGVVDAIRYFQCPKNTGMFLTRDQIISKEIEYEIGDTIEMDNHRTAILRFIGRMKTKKINKSPEYRYGIELVGVADGNHDGKVGLNRYFKCPPKRGMMLPRSRILRVIQRARDKVFSSVENEEKSNSYPSSFSMLSKLRNDLEKLNGSIILPTSRAVLTSAFQNLDKVTDSLRRHPITGLPNQLAFQDDIKRFINKLITSKNALGIAIFHAKDLDRISTVEAKAVLINIGEVLDDMVTKISSQKESNTKFANEMLGLMNKRKLKSASIDKGPRISKRGIMKLYHFNDFTHRFYIMKQQPGEMFLLNMNNLATQAEANAKITIVSSTSLLKKGETADGFVARCLARLNKASAKLKASLKTQELSSVV